MDWTGGYVTDILYTYGYYSELNPLNARFLCLVNGIACRKEFKNACELGFGQGMSINVHACSSKTHWYGTDFNPSQVDFARSLAGDAEFTVHLYDDSFEDFVNNPELPQFDFIALHGIWSWVNDAAREAILTFIRKKLTVGGVLYISYNVNPGFLSLLPLRHLVKCHADLNGAPQGKEQAVKDSLTFIDRLFACNPRYLTQNPLVQAQFSKLAGNDPHYIAHEFLNEHWDLWHFDELAATLEQAKVQFAVSATVSENIDSIHLSKEQRAELAAIKDRDFRETVRDFFLNTRFIRDYFIKGVRQLTQDEQREQLLSFPVILLEPLSLFKYETQGTLGQIKLVGELYEPILKVLSDYAPHTLGEILERTASAGVNYGSLVSAILILMGKGSVRAAQSYDEALVRQCQRLNGRILSRATGKDALGVLASPVIGGGIGVSQMQQLLILGADSGTIPLEVEPLAKYLATLLTQIGATVTLKDKGEVRTFDSPEGLKEARLQAERFLALLPIYRALKFLE